MEVNLEELIKRFNPREYYTVQEATALLGERSVSVTKKLVKHGVLQRVFSAKQGKIYGAEILRRLNTKGRVARLRELGYDSRVIDSIKDAENYVSFDEAYNRLVNALRSPALVSQINAVFDSNKQERELALVAVLALSRATDFIPQREVYSIVAAMRKEYKLPGVSEAEFYRFLENLDIERIVAGRPDKSYALEGTLL